MTQDATAVGIDLGGTKLLLLARTPEGDVIERHQTGASFTPPELERAVGAFLGPLQPAPDAVGLAFPGLLDPDGRVEACDVLPRFVGWTPTRLREGPWRFRAVNDADAALAGELDVLEGTAAVVIVGTGIGAAFLVDGRPFRGERGWGGELGSNPIATMGGVKTLDQLASGDALVRRLGLDGAALADRAAAGEPAVLAAVREAGEALGLGLAGVLHLFNPSRLLLGGGVLRLPGYRDAALRVAASATLPSLWLACEVREFRNGERAVALGAARLAAGPDPE